jgi:glucosyl-3-phosphoglycerate synthase
LRSVVDRKRIFAKPRVRVTHNPWDDLKSLIQTAGYYNLLVIDRKSQLEEFKLSARDLILNAPCDFAVVRGPFPEELKTVVIPVRAAGPHGELAFRTGLKLAEENHSFVKTFYIESSNEVAEGIEPLFGLEQAVREMPNVEHENIVGDESRKIILEVTKKSDLVICGTTTDLEGSSDSFGDIPDALFEARQAAVVALNARPSKVSKEARVGFDARAISVLVDKWFAESTFHCEEFSDVGALVDLKEERGVTISLALPALNEEKTVGHVIEVVKSQLQEEFPLLDEIVLIDSNSTDKTRDIAESLGVPTYIHQEILPQYGARKGKGEALWKSLYVTSGDIVLWVDTDISNFDARFVCGLIGPLLYRSNLKLTKAFYRRPLKSEQGLLQHNRGGRVTELTARPLLNLFYPELSGIIQPLSGEYGGRREALEQLIFTSGYGVETSVLIDAFSKFGLSSIAQVDMVERVHNNQSLRALSKMSFAIIQTFASRAEKRFGTELLKDVNRSMKMIKDSKDGYSLVVEEIAERERPPMIELPEYRAKREKSREQPFREANASL